VGLIVAVDGFAFFADCSSKIQILKQNDFNELDLAYVCG
jgi:hypothetical protein